MLNGESRGSAQANDAAMGNADMALTGIDAAADQLVDGDKAYSSSGHESEGEKLAEHAVVGPLVHRRHVAMTVVVHAVNTSRRRHHRALLVHVNRRQQKHWHKHCQQHP